MPALAQPTPPWHSDVARLGRADVASSVGFVFETVGFARKALGERVPLIGFAGAPFPGETSSASTGRLAHRACHPICLILSAALGPRRSNSMIWYGLVRGLILAFEHSRDQKKCVPLTEGSCAMRRFGVSLVRPVNPLTLVAFVVVGLAPLFAEAQVKCASGVWVNSEASCQGPVQKRVEDLPKVNREDTAAKNQALDALSKEATRNSKRLDAEAATRTSQEAVRAKAVRQQDFEATVEKCKQFGHGDAFSTGDGHITQLGTSTERFQFAKCMAAAGQPVR
jgi:hypothetical protein